jgi:hypothetical protein
MKRLVALAMAVFSFSIANAAQLGVSYGGLSGPGVLTWSFTGDHKSFGLQLGASYQSQVKTWNAEPGFGYRRYCHAAPIEPYWGFCLTAPMHQSYVGKEFRAGAILGFAHDFKWNGADFSWEVETSPLALTVYTDPGAGSIAFSTNPTVSIGLNYFY